MMRFRHFMLPADADAAADVFDAADDVRRRFSIFLYF